MAAPGGRALGCPWPRAVFHAVVFVLGSAITHPRHRVVRRAARPGRRVEGVLERLVVVESTAGPLRTLASGVEPARIATLRRRLLARFARLGPHPPARFAGSGLGCARRPGSPQPLGNRAVEFAAEIVADTAARPWAWRRSGPLGGPALAPGTPGGRCGRAGCTCTGLGARRTPTSRSFGRAPPRRGICRGVRLGCAVPACRHGGGFAEDQPGKFLCDG